MINFLKQKDKQLHIGVCAVVAVFSPMMAVGLAIGKEYGDSRAKGNKWSWGDILADAIGIGVGAVINYLIF